MEMAVPLCPMAVHSHCRHEGRPGRRGHKGRGKQRQESRRGVYVYMPACVVQTPNMPCHGIVTEHGGGAWVHGWGRGGEERGGEERGQWGASS